MNKERTFKRVDYEAHLEQQIRLGDFVPVNYLARFIKATYESLPHYYLAGGMHPDHDTLNSFRQNFLDEIKEVFVQALLYAQELGHLKLGAITLDGSKIQADASKHNAVSYGRLQEVESQFRQEIEELLTLSSQAEREAWPDDFSPEYEIQLRRSQLAKLNQAKTVIEQRAEEPYQNEKAVYEAKVAERADHQQRTGKKAKERPPVAPTAGAQEKDQYNFTDPESLIMKQGNDFEQAFNTQAAVCHQSRLVVANTLSNQPTDHDQARPTLNAIPSQLGKPTAAALDAGYFNAETIRLLTQMGIDPHIATGRLPHRVTSGRDWRSWLQETPQPPPDDASPRLKMTYKLQTALAQVIYRLRKSTVEPVCGIIKEVLGFRQFSLRGLLKAAGEWNLVCLALQSQASPSLRNCLTLLCRADKRLSLVKCTKSSTQDSFLRSKTALLTKNIVVFSPCTFILVSPTGC